MTDKANLLKKKVEILMKMMKSGKLKEKTVFKAFLAMSKTLWKRLYSQK